MRRRTPDPQTLLVHDGELADVRALLEEIETPFAERRADLTAEDRAAPWNLVISSPRRILNLRLANSDARPVLIAMLDQDSRTLRNSLHRAGIRLLVRRPVHRATLRALIVHALYRGPEKRRATRVNIGAPIRYRSLWRSRPGILVDLSVGGCRVILDQPLARGKGFSLAVPAEIAGAGFTVKARVLSSGPHLGQPPGHFVASARFEQVHQRQHELLKRAVSAHADGPAVFTGVAPIAAAPPARDLPDAAETVAPPPAAAAEAPCAPAMPCESAAPPPAADAHSAALGEEADRVLMGRDLTIGGMRVNPHPLLEVGMNVKLAIHAEESEKPLVVRARVHRNDGDRGMVLRFHELDPEASRFLNEVMDHLPLVDVDDDGRGCLVTELLAAD